MSISTAVIVLCLTAAVAGGSSLLVRRALVRVGEIESQPWTSSLSYVATAYGVVLGFSIIFLFGEFAEARKAVGNEAAAIHAAFDEAQLFPADQVEIERALICYGRAVVSDDWPALQDGTASPVADEAYRALFTTLAGIETPSDLTFEPATATNLVAQLGNIAAAREVRVVAANVQTPPLLWVLLIFGGLLVITLLFVVTLRARPVAQAALVAVSAVFTTVMLLIVFALGAPFGEGSGRLSPTLIEERVTAMESLAPAAAAMGCDAVPSG